MRVDVVNAYLRVLRYLRMTMAIRPFVMRVDVVNAYLRVLRYLRMTIGTSG
jgi:hypothetical protein